MKPGIYHYKHVNDIEYKVIEVGATTFRAYVKLIRQEKWLGPLEFDQEPLEEWIWLRTIGVRDEVPGHDKGKP